MGVLFFLRSDGQYILVSDTFMAVFLFSIIILCDVLIRDNIVDHDSIFVLFNVTFRC